MQPSVTDLVTAANPCQLWLQLCNRKIPNDPCYENCFLFFSDKSFCFNGYKVALLILKDFLRLQYWLQAVTGGYSSIPAQLTRRSCTPLGMHFACLGRSVDRFVVPGSWVVVVLRGIGGLGGAEGTSCRSRWVVVCWFCVRACPRALCVMGGMRCCSCAFGSSGHQNGASRARER